MLVLSSYSGRKQMGRQEASGEGGPALTADDGVRDPDLSGPLVFRRLVKVTRQARMGPATPCPAPVPSRWGHFIPVSLDRNPMPTHQCSKAGFRIPLPSVGGGGGAMSGQRAGRHTHEALMRRAKAAEAASELWSREDRGAAGLASRLQSRRSALCWRLLG